MPEWTITLNEKVLKQFTITDGSSLTIGRSADADVVVDNTAISRKHTSLELKDGIYYLADLDSLNGTFVNGQKIEKNVPVSENDRIELGKFKLSIAQDTDQTASTSFATPMDIEDETLFISSKKAAEIMKPSPAGKPQHKLTVITGEASQKMLSLDGKTSIKIGKDASCDIVISGWFVAGAQCYILSRDEKFFIVPQQSWAGTYLNGAKIKNEQLLRKGDVIAIKSVQIRFE